MRPAEQLWPLTNTVLMSRGVASSNAHEYAQAPSYVALRVRPGLLRSTTLLHWPLRRLHTAHGQRRIWCVTVSHWL